MTHNHIMGGAQDKKVWDTHWWFAPEESQSELSTIRLLLNQWYKYGCTNPPNLTHIALIDSAAFLSLNQPDAPTQKAPTQKTQNTSPIRWIATHHNWHYETCTLELPPEEEISYTLPSIVNNLLAMCKLTDADCCVPFHQHGYIARMEVPKK